MQRQLTNAFSVLSAWPVLHYFNYLDLEGWRLCLRSSKLRLFGKKIAHEFAANSRIGETYRFSSELKVMRPLVGTQKWNILDRGYYLT